MGNPNGNLAGFTDPGDPNWQSNVLAMYRERNKRTGGRYYRLHINFDLAFRGLLNRAAEKRGISLSSYCRRAISAFVAHDLGLPFGDVLSYSPVASPYGDINRTRPARHRDPKTNRMTVTTDTPDGYGPWEITL